MTSTNSELSEPTYDRATAPDPNTAPEATTTLSQERLTVSTEWFVSGGVRLRRRVVTETRTMNVKVRREELVVEEHDAAVNGTSRPERAARPDAATAPAVVAPTGPPAPRIIVLREEVPKLTVRVQPYEQVTAHVVLLATTSTVTEQLRHEQISVQADPGTRTAGPDIRR